MTAIVEGFVHRERARFASELAAASEDSLRAALLAEVRACSAPFGKPPESWRLIEALAACRARSLGAWATAQLAAEGLAEPCEPAAAVKSEAVVEPEAAVEPEAVVEPQAAA